MLWFEKYRPKTIEGIIGNSEALEELQTWAHDWERGKNGKPLILHGPSGVGKTASAHALANSMNWGVLEVNAGDLRSKEKILSFLGDASESNGLFSGKTLFIIDEVDSASDRGQESAIKSIIEKARQPLLLIANDLYAKSISGLRSAAKPIHFKRINYRSIANLLEKIAQKENVAVDKELLLKISENSNGDVRSAINDLQMLGEGREKIFLKDVDSIGYRDREKNIFDAVRKVFKTMDYASAVEASNNLDVDPLLFVKWIEENIPVEYEKPEEIAQAYDMISRANIFEGRIRNRQYWGFLRYVIPLATAGVALAKKQKYSKFSKYRFPTFLRTKSRKEVLKKIGSKVHCSARKAESYLMMLGNDKGSEMFGLEDEDLAVLKINNKEHKEKKT